MLNDYRSIERTIVASNTKSLKWERTKAVHLYYRRSGFYSFLGSSLRKVLPYILGITAILILIDQFVIDFGIVFTYMTEHFSSFSITSVFFVSESFLGLLPPEVFIAWSAKTASPMVWLTVLAALSYIGGIVSFMIGRTILKVPSIHNYMEVKMATHIKQARKWGGVLILVGALLPLPFSMASIAAGLIKFNFRHYLLLGLFRFIRFYIAALAVYSIV